MTSHVVAHVVRRGAEAVHDHYSQRQAYIQRLEHDAELYELSGAHVDPEELLPVLLTGLVAILVICSIDYTVGQVMATLASIETPSSTAIIETGPPAYADLRDEKEPLVSVDPEEDVEITVIDHKPVTAKIRTTIRHLHRVGGFTARWRGIGLSALYHFLHGSSTKLLAHALGLGIGGEVFCYIFVSLSLSRVHMAWTQKMITAPSDQWWFQRLPARKNCRALLLPNLAYALAQQATIALPIGVAFALGVAGPDRMRFDGTQSHNCTQAFTTALRFLAVPLTYVAVALLVLFPASVTLTRIEAALLPEDQQTIVPFDKAAVLADADISTMRGRRSLFVQAWRSFDRASRARLVKVYVKMFLAQLAVAFVAVHVIIAELYLIGIDRLAVLFRSGVAQLKLMAIQAHENAQ